MEKKKREVRNESSTGMSRRNFLGTVSVGALGATIARPAPRAAAQEASGGLPQVTITINGRIHQLHVEPRWTLLYVLREKLGLTGTKPGCERGECGSCTVLIDGITRYSCLTLALEADGRQVTTVEGLLQGEQLGPVQQGFLEEDGFQCGYCTPGQVMAAEGLLRQKPNPTIDEIRIGMSGNLCRCGAYDHIFKSVRRAAELRK
jgi:xanthine dehydrogenase YagT iron-sulfur-binding subunit